MATWFEIRVASGDRAYAQQAAAEVFRLIDHLEGLLSRYREGSDVARISQLAPGEHVIVSPDTFACLTLALEMSELTGGAFDPTLGRAMDRWRDARGLEPATTESAAGPGGVAADTPNNRGQLVLDPAALGVGCERLPVSLDLGAVGKGFALDRARDLLDEWEVGPCLLIGGGSSILATGALDDGWEVGLTSTTLLRLTEGSVGCSGLAVKGAHILDPRTGSPAVTPARAWALSARAAVSDALSTAFMLLPREDIEAVCAERPEAGAVVQWTEPSPEVLRIGRALGVHHGWIHRPSAV